MILDILVSKEDLLDVTDIDSEVEPVIEFRIFNSSS